MKRFCNIIILLFACLFFGFSKVEAKELKFVQITDAHFSSGSVKYTQEEVSEANRQLELAINDINRIKNLDFVVFTGDNIDSANQPDLKRFLSIANKLNVPYYVVIGNHEVFRSQNFDKKAYMKTVRRYGNSHNPKAANYVFKKKGVVFLVADGAKEIIPGPAGYYKKKTMTWLEKNLKKYKNRNVIIFQHFPLIEPYRHRTHVTYNAQEYLDMLAKYDNVKAVVSGHYHTNSEITQDGVYHINSPALIVPPHDYKLIEINYDKDNFDIYTMIRHAE